VTPSPDSSDSPAFSESPQLRDFAQDVAKLAALIGAPAGCLPTYGRTEDFARPHIEFDEAGYHMITIERGQELERHTSHDDEEILYRVFESVTFEMACDHEVQHRRVGDDPRRQLHEKQLMLMGKLSDDWQARLRATWDEILSRNPFRDA